MKINLHHLTHTVARAAPLLGHALAGPSGAAIGQILAAKFGGDVNEPESLHALIQADPDAHLKLKQIELDHEVELQRLTLQAAGQALQETMQDRASARQREISTASVPRAQRDWTPAILAYCLTLIICGVLWALFHCDLPDKNQMVILGIVSSLITVWIGAMGYYHGSSMGARDKDPGWIQHWHHLSTLPAAGDR